MTFTTKTLFTLRDNDKVVISTDSDESLSDELADNVVTSIRDASGNVVGLSAGNSAYPPHLTFAALMAAYPPSESIAGMHAWCTDYPSVGGFGAEVVCTGSRWKSISQQHCLLSPPSAVAGTLFGAGSAAALYGSTVSIPGGVLQPDDNIRMLVAAQHPTLGSTSRRLDLTFSTTAIGVVSGSKGLGFSNTSSSSNNVNIEKLATLLSETTIRSNNVGSFSAATYQTFSQTELTIPTITADTYTGIVVTPSADTSWLIYAASVYVEFAR